VRTYAPRAARRLTAEPDLVQRPVGYTPRRGSRLTGYERVLVRAGLGPVAGLDEAGRGACAGPLVVAAVALDRFGRGRLPGAADVEIADSKALTARAREAAYRRIVRSALAWSVVVIEPGDIDRFGLHICNVAGMRRALAGLPVRPGFALTDGFEVPGLAVPALAMWKGDQVAACVAAASIVAKVTRDKIMRTLHAQHPEYGFARNKGYSTPGHMAALDAHGPSLVHRRSFVNVLCRMGDGGPDAAGCAMPADDDVCVDVDAGGEGPIVELTVGSAAAAGPVGSAAAATAAVLAGPRLRARSRSVAPAALEGRR
jgi:ribonuclease HII